MNPDNTKQFDRLRLVPAALKPPAPNGSCKSARECGEIRLETFVPLLNLGIMGESMSARECGDIRLETL